LDLTRAQLNMNGIARENKYQSQYTDKLTKQDDKKMPSKNNLKGFK